MLYPVLHGCNQNAVQGRQHDTNSGETQCVVCAEDSSMGSQERVDAEVQEVLAHAEQPLLSLTPHRKPATRSAMPRHSWSHQQSVCLNP